MSITVRIKNALKYGGIAEVVRKAYYYIIYHIANYFTIVETKISDMSYGLNKDERPNSVVISLTSYPKRFEKIGLCLKSLIQQTIKPDKIIVYLGSDSDETDITDEMKEYIKYGIEYRIDKEVNLMPHKKYYYAMREYPDSIIVTADDDVIYPKNWLESLLKTHQKYPEAVCARRVHLIGIRGGRILPYNEWTDQIRTVLKPSMQLIAIGNGGVLYPPNCFDDEAFNIDEIKKTCLKADDLWLKCMEIRNQIPVVWVKNWHVDPPSIGSSEKLSSQNVFNGNNDLIFKNLMTKYAIEPRDFLSN